MKKILALALAVILAVSCLTVPSFSAESNYDLNEEMELLYALGIILSPSSTDEVLASTVTRGEAAKLFCRVMNVEASDPQGFESVFYDVTSETPNYKYIAAICNAGYMQGYGDGRFRPLNPITTKEAALVLSRLIGYKGYTAVRGFDNTMSKTGILDGVPVVDEVESGQLIQMIYNALHAPACVATGIVNGSMNYKIDEDYLGIDYLLKISVAKGIVDGIQGSTLTDGDFELKDNGVVIDGFVYTYDKDPSDMFGYAVDFYYRNNVESYDVVYMKKSEKNKTLTLNYDQIVDYSNFRYSYEVNGDIKNVEIEADTDIINNDVAYTMPTQEVMIPKYGNVTLIDNDGDRKYDVVSVESYEFWVVDSVNVEKKIIKDKNGTDILDLQDADKISLVYDGKEYGFDRLYSGNLLKVKRSAENGGYYKVSIEVNKDEESGAAITATSQNTLTALGKTYTLWDNIDEASRESIFVGSIAAIYLYDNMVVRVEKEQGLGSYGYLMSISEPEPFSSSLQFRLILSDANQVIFEKGKNIKVDGVLITQASDVERALRAGAALSANPSSILPLAQPVKYSLSADGKLVSLDTLYFNAEKEDEETSLKKLETATYKYRTTSKGLYKYNSADKTSPDLSAVGSNFLLIPKTERNSVLDYSKSVPSENGNYLMDICNVNEDNKVAEFTFYYRDTYTTGTSSALYVVLENRTELNSDGDVTHSLFMGSGGKEYTFPVVEEMIERCSELQTGDIVSITLNGKSQIRGITKKYSLASAQPPLEERVVVSQSRYNTTKQPPHTDGYRILYGTALNVDSGSLLFTPSLTTDLGGINPTYEVDNILISGVTIYKYSEIRGIANIELVSEDEIVTYNMDKNNPSTVVVDIQNSAVKQVFVMEKEEGGM